MRGLWPREELEKLLRRCSKQDRDRVLAEFEHLRTAAFNADAMRRRRAREEEDLRIVVADQRRHIANLEAQLLPYLTGRSEAEQDAML